MVLDLSLGEQFLKDKDNRCIKLIFIPGGPGMGSEYFNSLIHYFDAFEIGVFENVGTGASNFDDLTKKFVDYIVSTSELDQNEIVLVAHSFGSLLILNSLDLLLHCHNVKVSGLVLVSWLYDCKVLEARSKYSKLDYSGKGPFSEEKNRTPNENFKEYNKYWAEAYFSSAQMEVGVKTLNNMSYDAQIWENLREEVFESIDLNEKLPTVSLPVLSLHGEKDDSVPYEYIEEGFKKLGSYMKKLVKVKCRTLSIFE